MAFRVARDADAEAAAVVVAPAGVETRDETHEIRRIPERVLAAIVTRHVGGAITAEKGGGVGMDWDFLTSWAFFFICAALLLAVPAVFLAVVVAIVYTVRRTVVDPGGPEPGHRPPAEPGN